MRQTLRRNKSATGDAAGKTELQASVEWGRVQRPHRDKKHSLNSKAPLSPKESSDLRERLLGEIGNISSSDEAALWAFCNIKIKGSLTTADAETVEETFRSVVAACDRPLEESERPSPLPDLQVNNSITRRSSTIVDKSVLTLPEPRRLRDRNHVKHVAAQACLICGRQPSDAHHLRFAQSRALGRKVSDEFTVPLCRGHHRDVHRHGDESSWWRTRRIDPTAAARTLWLSTHPLPTENDEDTSSFGRSD
jgi:hypothetical protein